MKLLLICKDFLPNIGGIPIMMHHLSNALTDRKVAVLVAPPPPDGDVPFSRKYHIAKGNRKDWGRGPWYTRPFREVRYKRQIAGLIEDFRPDALLLGDQAYTGQYAEAALWARSRYGIPIGAFCHGLDVRKKLLVPPAKHRQVINRVSGLIKVTPAYQRVKNLLKTADCVFANSAYTAGLVRALTNRPAVVTGCGLAEEEWQREMQLTPAFDRRMKQQRKSQLGLGKSPVIAFIGRLVPRKNIGLLLEALTENREAQLVVIGDGPLRPVLQKKAGDLKIDDRVTWMGETDEDQKWKVLRASDVLCLPATEGDNGDVEGFGIVLLEAAAAGTPAVVAASGGMTDVVKDRVTGLLCHNPDPGDLAAKLHELITDENLAENCVANLRRRIREDFNWSEVAQKVIQSLR